MQLGAPPSPGKAAISRPERGPLPPGPPSPPLSFPPGVAPPGPALGQGPPPGPALGQGPPPGPALGQGPPPGPALGQGPPPGPALGQGPPPGPALGQGPPPGPALGQGPPKAQPLLRAHRRPNLCSGPHPKVQPLIGPLFPPKSNAPLTPPPRAIYYLRAPFEAQVAS
ncbi:hypothetical protein XENTR_v10020047 [Xenopus tropicalis]|nr:hypothetical protein XENTR_v10020047 [Xenopus tropicalis]